jgi:hypothetical protein|nr:MAG TPA: hypothetical protein [Caudoviricetes sp.]
MILDIGIGIEIVIFLVSLFYEICTTSSVVISEEDE